MNTYNIVIIDKNKKQQQLNVSASAWQKAIDAAKTQSGLEVGPDTDANLVIVQFTGKIHIAGQ